MKSILIFGSKKLGFPERWNQYRHKMWIGLSYPNKHLEWVVVAHKRSSYPKRTFTLIPSVLNGYREGSSPMDVKIAAAVPKSTCRARTTPDVNSSGDAGTKESCQTRALLPSPSLIAEMTRITVPAISRRRISSNGVGETVGVFRPGVGPLGKRRTMRCSNSLRRVISGLFGGLRWGISNHSPSETRFG